MTAHAPKNPAPPSAVPPSAPAADVRDGGGVRAPLGPAPGESAGASSVSANASDRAAARQAAERGARELDERVELRVAERTAEAVAQTERLRAVATELGEVDQRERRRLAKTLHDHVQQLLVGAKLRLDVLRRRPGDAALVPQIVDDVQQLLDQVIHATRLLTAELSPPVLFDAGLPAALEWLGGHLQRETGLEIVATMEECASLPEQGVQVFLFEAARELLANVIKHSGERSARLRFGPRDPEHVAVTVEDDGAGFDPTHLDMRLGGAAFGLSAIRERAQLLGGHLELETTPGAGLCATVVVPLGASPIHRSEQSDTGGHDSPAVAPRPETPAIEAVRVLVADDHAVVRRGLLGLLALEPNILVVAQAANGREALEQAREHRPDVVVMDIDMPVIGGVEATRRLKTEMPDVKVIGLSIHDESTVADSILAAGATAYVTKARAATALCGEIRRAASERTESDH